MDASARRGGARTQRRAATPLHGIVPCALQCALLLWLAHAPGATRANGRRRRPRAAGGRRRFLRLRNGFRDGPKYAHGNLNQEEHAALQKCKWSDVKDTIQTVNQKISDKNLNNLKASYHQLQSSCVWPYNATKINNSFVYTLPGRRAVVGLDADWYKMGQDLSKLCPIRSHVAPERIGVKAVDL